MVKSRNRKVRNGLNAQIFSLGLFIMHLFGELAYDFIEDELCLYQISAFKKTNPLHYASQSLHTLEKLRIFRIFFLVFCQYFCLIDIILRNGYIIFLEMRERVDDGDGCFDGPCEVLIAVALIVSEAEDHNIRLFFPQFLEQELKDDVGDAFDHLLELPRPEDFLFFVDDYDSAFPYIGAVPRRCFWG